MTEENSKYLFNTLPFFRSHIFNHLSAVADGRDLPAGCVKPGFFKCRLRSVWIPLLESKDHRYVPLLSGSNQNEQVVQETCKSGGGR